MRRGDDFRLRLGRRQGHGQSGVRYAVIVQSDALMRLSTVLVSPTSTAARPASFRPEIEVDGHVTRVLVEQTGAVDISRLGDRHAPDADLTQRWDDRDPERCIDRRGHRDVGDVQLADLLDTDRQPCLGQRERQGGVRSYAGVADPSAGGLQSAR